MKRQKIVIIAVAVVAALLLGLYGASPYLAVNSLKTAIRDGDRDGIERLVDFGSVREGLKAQMAAQMTTALAKDGSMADNPFAGLAVLMIPALVNHVVDGYVTPDGLATLAAGEKPQVSSPQTAAAAMADPPTPETKAKVLKNATLGYAGLDTFEVVTPVDDKGGLTFVMRREGVFGWKVKRIDLPAALFDQGAAS